jgi:hypothetical protein
MIKQYGGLEPRGSRAHGIGKTRVSGLRVALGVVICKGVELIPFGGMLAPEILVATEALAPAALLRAALRAAGPPLVTEPRPHRTPVGMAMIELRHRLREFLQIARSRWSRSST